MLLPSDCIKYRDSDGFIRLGRIKCIGVDKRQLGSGGIAVLVNPLVSPQDLPQAWRYKYDHLCLDIFKDASAFALGETDLPELILVETRHIIPINQIICREWVYFVDYPTEEELRPSLLPHPATYCVRRIAYSHRGRNLLRAVYKRHRVIAEEELYYFGRDYILSEFVAPLQTDSSTPTPRRLSVPFTTFLDGFGLYRNAYHSLNGMYVTPASLDIKLRSKLQNVYVLMIGPFGCDEKEMAKCLEREALASGSGYKTTLLSGETVIVCAFPLCFTGDMPQQNSNSGCKTHNGYKGCRFCFITDEEKGNLHENVIESGRYREPIKRLRIGAFAQRTQESRNKQLQGNGLTLDGPYFERCYPLMDPQRCHPNDAFHAELRLEKYYQEVLIDSYLTSAGATAYRAVWDDIKLPYGWGQPQNPVSHKGSMVFSEYGRLAIMNPLVILRMYARNGAVNGQLPKRQWIWKHDQLKKFTSEFGLEEVLGIPSEHQILRTAYLHAKAVYYTMNETLLAEDRENIYHTVLSVWKRSTFTWYSCTDCYC